MKLDDCPDDVLTREQVMAVFKVPSLNSLYRRLQKGRFPAPAMTHPMRWFKNDLRKWMEGESRPRAMRRSA